MSTKSPDDISPDKAAQPVSKTPPKPFTPKANLSPRPPATKAEHASFKRSNKMAFKPAPKKS
jgi:hypothetical protein